MRDIKFSPIVWEVARVRRHANEDEALPAPTTETAEATTDDASHPLTEPIFPDAWELVTNNTIDMGRCMGIFARFSEFVKERYSEFSIQVSHR